MWPFKRKKASKREDSIDVNEAVTNPELKSAIQTFNINKSEKMLLKVISEMKMANFLALIDRDGLNTTESSHEGIVNIEKGSTIKFFYTFNEKGECFFPLFTDWKEVNLWAENNNIIGWIMPSVEAFQFILRDKNTLGLVINPCTDRWTMHKEQIDNFLKDI